MGTTTEDQEHVEALVNYILQRGGGVSFVELTRVLDDRGFPTKGQYAVEIGGEVSNVVLWADMTHEYVELVKALIADGRVRFKSTDFLVYLIDGGMLNMPLAKRPPKAGYKEPHWAPVSFDPVEVG